MPPKRIKQIMQALGMDKATFAKAIGVSDRTVDGYLSKRPPSRAMRRIIESVAK